MRSTSAVQGVPKVLFCISITYVFLAGHLESEQFIEGADGDHLSGLLSMTF